MKHKFNHNLGFTMIELVVYTALLSFITLYVVFFAINTFEAEQKSRAKREVVLASERGMRVITEEIRRSAGIYEPTSIFNSSSGQLSLITTNATTDEAFGFIDFYLDSGIIYKKEEGKTAEAITSPNVVVTNLTFTLIDQGSPKVFPESVVVYISARNRTDDLGVQSSFDLRSAASPRAYFDLPEIEL